MTTTLILSLLGAFWVLCGVFAYGLNFAYFQRKYPELARVNYFDDLLQAFFSFMLGPISLLVEIKNYEGYGLKWK